MTTPKRSIRVSASRIKSLKQCSLVFWYQEVMRVPSSTHVKTRQGSMIHSIFEHLFAPKRRAALQHILLHGFVLDDWPSIQRYIRLYDYKHKIAPYDMRVMGEMLGVAFVGIKLYFLDSKGEYQLPPRILTEHRFQYITPEGAELAGFIDLLLLWEDRAVVVDLKSQGTKFPRAEVPNNVQAAIYQLAVHHEFGFVPVVDFILVRHGPTKFTPDKHIQRVRAPSDVTLSGLRLYLGSMHERFNSFGLADAYANPCSDEGFCQRVCSYLRPYSYYVLCDPDDPEGDNPISSHLTLDLATQARETRGSGVILTKQHPGCAVRWTQRT